MDHVTWPATIAGDDDVGVYARLARSSPGDGYGSREDGCRRSGVRRVSAGEAAAAVAAYPGRILSIPFPSLSPAARPNLVGHIWLAAAPGRVRAPGARAGRKLDTAFKLASYIIALLDWRPGRAGRINRTKLIVCNRWLSVCKF